MTSQSRRRLTLLEIENAAAVAAQHLEALDEALVRTVTRRAQPAASLSQPFYDDVMAAVDRTAPRSLASSATAYDTCNQPQQPAAAAVLSGVTWPAWRCQAETVHPDELRALDEHAAALYDGTLASVLVAAAWHTSRVPGLDTWQRLVAPVAAALQVCTLARATMGAALCYYGDEQLAADAGGALAMAASLNEQAAALDTDGDVAAAVVRLQWPACTVTLRVRGGATVPVGGDNGKALVRMVLHLRKTRWNTQACSR